MGRTRNNLEATPLYTTYMLRRLNRAQMNVTVSESCRDAHTHTQTHSSSHVYPVINIAGALDWPCRLLHSYGFMLHHHGISFSVDYNSQKPLIKPCGAKAFCFVFIIIYLWMRVRPLDLLIKTQQAKYPINRSTPPNNLFSPKSAYEARLLSARCFHLIASPA